MVESQNTQFKFCTPKICTLLQNTQFKFCIPKMCMLLLPDPAFTFSVLCLIFSALYAFLWIYLINLNLREEFGWEELQEWDLQFGKLATNAQVIFFSFLTGTLESSMQSISSRFDKLTNLCLLTSRLQCKWLRFWRVDWLIVIWWAGQSSLNLSRGELNALFPLSQRIDCLLRIHLL